MSGFRLDLIQKQQQQQIETTPPLNRFIDVVISGNLHIHCSQCLFIDMLYIYVYISYLMSLSDLQTAPTPSPWNSASPPPPICEPQTRWPPHPPAPPGRRRSFLLYRRRKWCRTTAEEFFSWEVLLSEVLVWSSVAMKSSTGPFQWGKAPRCRWTEPVEGFLSFLWNVNASDLREKLPSRLKLWTDFSSIKSNR